MHRSQSQGQSWAGTVEVSGQVHVLAKHLLCAVQWDICTMPTQFVLTNLTLVQLSKIWILGPGTKQRGYPEEPSSALGLEGCIGVSQAGCSWVGELFEQRL